MGNDDGEKRSGRSPFARPLPVTREKQEGDVVLRSEEWAKWGGEGAPIVPQLSSKQTEEFQCITRGRARENANRLGRAVNVLAFDGTLLETVRPAPE